MVPVLPREGRPTVADGALFLQEKQRAFYRIRWKFSSAGWKIKKEAKAESDPEKKKLLDVKSRAKKYRKLHVRILRLRPRKVVFAGGRGEGIAAYGREYIHKTIEEANAGFKVVYGDTDSVYYGRANKKLSKTQRHSQRQSIHSCRKRWSSN